MRLTPLEIRKQTFARRRMGGVDPEEVQDFLNLIATEFEEVLQDNTLVSERLVAANQKISEFRAMEETLRRTLIRAEQLSSESKDAARRESDIVLQEARLRAERVLADARSRLRQLNDEIEELSKKKEVFLHRFRSLVEMQLDLLDQHRGDFDEISEIVDESRRAMERHARPLDGAPPTREPEPEADGTDGRNGEPRSLEERARAKSGFGVREEG